MVGRRAWDFSFLAARDIRQDNGVVGVPAGGKASAGPGLGQRSGSMGDIGPVKSARTAGVLGTRVALGTMTVAPARRLTDSVGRPRAPPPPARTADFEG